MRSRLSTIPLLAALALLVTLALAALAAAPARAQQQPLVPLSLETTDPNVAPEGFALTPNEARRAAERSAALRKLLAEDERLRSFVQIPLYTRTKGPRYEVFYLTGSVPVADIHVDARSGEILEEWTGPQADFPLARGRKPPVARSLNSPWIFLPLAALFILPFVDPRRPLRLIHLDLLVMLGFSLSLIWFNRGDVDISVPLVYPFLAYLLVRLAFAGFRPKPSEQPLVPFARVSWLAVGLVVLVAFRLVLNIVDSAVIDVGYASVVGADRIAHGEELYVFNEIHGDTYGPINYVAYLPFELIFPNDGTWRDVPAAHAAALTFDLLTILGLTLLGTRLRKGREGRRLGLALAFAWAAYPFTTYTLQANSNDGLVAMLLVFALLALKSPAARGAWIGLGAAAKFAPLALAPLFATGTGEERRLRSWPAFAAAAIGVLVISIGLYLPDGGLREFYDATLGFQMGRRSPFSLWGLYPSTEWLQEVLKLGAVAFGGLLAFVPRRRDLRAIAALGAALLIAVQLPAVHWFYFYLVWIAPFALVAIFGAYRWRDAGDEMPVRARETRVGGSV